MAEKFSDIPESYKNAIFCIIMLTFSSSTLATSAMEKNIEIYGEISRSRKNIRRWIFLPLWKFIQIEIDSVGVCHSDSSFN